MIAAARVEAEALVARSRADAEVLREDLRQKARAEAAGIVKNAERQIQLETARAVQQIRSEAVEISVAIASKILRRQVSSEDNAALIEETLRQVEGRHHV
jgi:F-type H+-transporting ATPase subunit b